MINGNLIKEKRELVFERFKTKEGLFDFFVGSFLWGFIIYQAYRPVKDWIFLKYDFIPVELLRQYASFLTTAFLTTILGLVITFVLVQVYNIIFNGKTRKV